MGFEHLGKVLFTYAVIIALIAFGVGLAIGRLWG